MIRSGVRPARVIAQAQARAVSARALSTASRSYVARVGAAIPGAGAGALRSLVRQTPAVLASSGARFASSFKTAYDAKVAERTKQKIVPMPILAEECSELVKLLENPPKGEEAFLMDLLENRVPPGVDEAAYVKAGFLTAVVEGKTTSPLIDKVKAVQLLGTMQGGYNVGTLINALDDPALAPTATKALKTTLLLFDSFYDVEAKAKAGNAHAKEIMQSWADAEWFLAKPEVPKKMTLTVFMVKGETNTDDLSPAPDAWSRPDIPLHALSMFKIAREGIHPDEDGVNGPVNPRRTRCCGTLAKTSPTCRTSAQAACASARRSRRSSSTRWRTRARSRSRWTSRR
ncbi:aconitate B N-terminal domain-containing protein [Baffinella frigidus]|nr:aconitate B N-terminal domain-containing protein [Cryptophyta sp. CCMP2293]